MFRLPGRPPHHRLTTVQQPRPWHPAHTHSQKKLNSRAHTTPKKRASAFGGGRHPKKVGKWVEGRFREGECDSRPGKIFCTERRRNCAKMCQKNAQKYKKNVQKMQTTFSSPERLERRNKSHRQIHCFQISLEASIAHSRLSVSKKQASH